MTLESFDLAILGLLQRDNTTSQRVIGEAMNLSAPAVQQRIKKPEAAGVIAAHVAVIDPAKVGLPSPCWSRSTSKASASTCWTRSRPGWRLDQRCSSATTSQARPISCW
ncbi:Lrp/AsnC family transcriptional regulator [Caulobacter sp. DWR2-3-1b2]|uniref:Lrp/AsnC family transcriptional regulator n=1 Tax=unclassified Caulobacter TaxID=2648921 RepID=UPI003CEE7523